MARKPQVPTATLTVKVPYDLKQQFIDECRLREITMTEAVNKLIMDFLQEVE